MLSDRLWGASWNQFFSVCPNRNGRFLFSLLVALNIDFTGDVGVADDIACSVIKDLSPDRLPTESIKPCNH